MFFSHLWIVFILALSQNIDDFISGMAFGMRKTVFSTRTLFSFMLGSTLSMLVAMELGRFLTEILTAGLTNYLSIFLLVGLGVWMIWKTWSPGSKSDGNLEFSNGKKDCGGFWVMFTLGMALGIDDVVEAIGLSMVKFPVIMTVLVFKAVQLIAIFAGAQLGYLGVSKIKVPKLNFIPGIILILLGLKQLFTIYLTK